ncbi:MAG: FtsQ-type POTRA domain-containing protein [Puniceicoccales bacterium]|jgi:cell division septal protein FtsQ|nr:FtsQ-type POTRA domain-containing protein [Puniceicoccales bacterium]
MWFFRKKSDPSVKQITAKGQKKCPSKFEKFSLGKFFFKITAYCLFLWGLFYGGNLLWSEIGAPLRAWSKSIYKQPLNCVKFKSNGVLTPQWVKPFLPDLRIGVDMMDIDIFAIKQKIETCSQIKTAVVERQFPGTLKITVEERIPLLRLLVRDGKLTNEMLIDGEGVVFHGEEISEFDRRSMPFLSGIVLKKTRDGYYEQVPMLDKVYRLIHIAKTKYWSIYAQMEVISIEKLKKKSVPWSRIDVRCQCASLVIFEDGDFDEQLKRLDLLLNTPKIRERLPVERIDLSLGKNAAIKF